MRVGKHHTRGSGRSYATKNFYLFFRDRRGRREQKIPLPKCLDRRLAEIWAVNVEALQARRMSGQPPTPELMEWLESRGVPRQIIMQIFGHKSTAMGAIYTHPDWLAMKREAVAKMPTMKLRNKLRATGTEGK